MRTTNKDKMRKCIRITNHNPDCPDPSNCRASYSRKTVGKGEQRYKHDFNRCLSCGVFEQVDFTGGEYEYERIGDTNILKLTRKIRTKAFGNLDRKLSSEDVECVRRVTGLTIEEPTTTYSKRPSVCKTRLLLRK